MSFEIEAFDRDRDRTAVHRIWAEVGWADLSNENEVKGMDSLFAAGPGWVVRQNGEAECSVFTTSGDMDYLGERLPLGGVSAVTTSRVAKKQGYAARVTAHAVANEVAKGALVSNLGMFEQGYYDRLGFGSGNYAQWVRFDPQELFVENCRRVPVRLTPEDYEEIHACRLKRQRSHGSVSFESAALTHERMIQVTNTFGLGFRDGDNGELTHLFCGYTPEPEYGPYTILFYAYETREQFLELMGLIKNLGDHVQRVGMIEPAGIQLTDLVKMPIRRYLETMHTQKQMGVRSLAMWQLRINDLVKCLERTHLGCESFRFNLRLRDPIETLLPEEAAWRGCAGEYVVTLGPESGADPGSEAALETLDAGVGSFSRMWLGLRPATGLAYTTDLTGPATLLAKLDRAFTLPTPKRGWPF